MRDTQRLLFVATALIACAGLVLGPILWLRTNENINDVEGLTCSLGELLSSAPVARRSDQTQKEFERNVTNLRHFASDLEELVECPIDIEILVEGGGGSSGEQPSSPPGGGTPGPRPDPPKPGPTGDCEGFEAPVIDCIELPEVGL